MYQIWQNAFFSLAFVLFFLISIISRDKKLRFSEYFLWLYCAFSSLWPSFSIEYNPQDYLHPIFITASKLTAAQSLVLILSLPISVLYLSKIALMNILKIYFATEALLVIITGHTLTLGWSSYSSVMLALSLSLFIPTEEGLLDKVALCLIFIASFVNMSVTTGLVYLFYFTFTFWKYSPPFVVLVNTLLGAWFVYEMPPELTNGNGRYPMWIDFFHAWMDKLPKVFGIGLGTFEWVGAQLQGSKDIMGYGILHNDFFQFLIEAGVLGFLILLWVIYDNLRDNWRNRDYIKLAGCFFIGSMLYFPLHSIPGQLLALLILQNKKCRA